jgi:hypothetical protein
MALDSKRSRALPHYCMGCKRVCCNVSRQVLLLFTLPSPQSSPVLPTANEAPMLLLRRILPPSPLPAAAAAPPSAMRLRWLLLSAAVLLVVPSAAVAAPSWLLC